MFFIDDDQTQPRHRREHGQARAEHQVGLADVRGQPVAQALRRRQAAVQRHQVVTGKALGQAGFELRREVDLGHQHQHLAARGQGLCGRVQVDLGLAAAGDTMQQVGGGCVAEQCVDGGGLIGRQGRRRRVAATGLACGLEAREAAVELGRVEPAQFGRQHRQGQLAQAALVVAGSKGDQLAPGIGQRRQRAQRLAHRAQLNARGSGAGTGLPDDARHVARTQRHAHQRSRSERLLTRVVQAGRQPGVLRRLDGDAQGD